MYIKEHLNGFESEIRRAEKKEPERWCTWENLQKNFGFKLPGFVWYRKIRNDFNVCSLKKARNYYFTTCQKNTHITKKLAFFYIINFSWYLLMYYVDEKKNLFSFLLIKTLFFFFFFFNRTCDNLVIIFLYANIAFVKRSSKNFEKWRFFFVSIHLKASQADWIVPMPLTRAMSNFGFRFRSQQSRSIIYIHRAPLKLVTMHTRYGITRFRRHWRNIFPPFSLYCQSKSLQRVFALMGKKKIKALTFGFLKKLLFAENFCG